MMGRLPGDGGNLSVTIRYSRRCFLAFDIRYKSPEPSGSAPESAIRYLA